MLVHSSCYDRFCAPFKDVLLAMKRILRRFKEKLTFKDPPPPYQENDVAINEIRLVRHDNDFFETNAPACDSLDLLANCKVPAITDDNSEAEYAEIQEMGLWHSTPLSHRRKSKISLTWVLKENLESAKLQPKKEEKLNPVITTDDRYRNFKLNENERHRKYKSCERERIVGRNEYYHNLRFKSACEEFASQETYSDTSVGTEYTRRKHRHRHRRKKRSSSAKFGYDIRDLDSFLSEASIDRPGNIPVVIAYPTTLYQTHKDCDQELQLPLGTVVNAVFKKQQWLYAQTPHGQEGYVLYTACLPLGILPNRTPQNKTPCWESSTDIYPRPCGNLTDNEKEIAQMRGRSRSECRYRRREKKRAKNAEKDFDSLYLKTKSATDLNKLGKENYSVDNVNKNTIKQRRRTLLVVNSDYKGSSFNRTLSVNQGDVVVLAQGHLEADMDAEWFYVKKSDGSYGFIPASVAGNGYI